MSVIVPVATSKLAVTPDGSVPATRTSSPGLKLLTFTVAPANVSELATDNVLSTATATAAAGESFGSMKVALDPPGAGTSFTVTNAGALVMLPPVPCAPAVLWSSSVAPIWIPVLTVLVSVLE
ncbi:hypothetical protein AWB69_08714 [Caballeronia udeis]|uniref:Uncharacterized protein n=1 Tax=Caballeronia udeis TaxID=1232866 RepID=A0A158JSF3_9BURK|nr:hypothetical protein AWB69_08714 [Caballeronia udeis]